MMTTQRRLLGVTTAALLIGSVILANWLLDRFGVVPLGFGLEGPAGVYAAGLAFGLRDAVHELMGRAWVFAAIVLGALVSFMVGADANLGGPVSLAVASALAFALSEAADLVVYEPLRRRQWAVAVVVSNVVGSVVDSAVFLWLAFGAFDHIGGQVVGKTYMVVVALPFVWSVRRAISGDRQRVASL